ncbi:hypothetical protein ACLMJK_000476 [Lecanora helva]
MPQPYFWIRRNGDTFVPLIPVDELPPWVALRGISATRNWEDLCRGEMKFLGDHSDHNGDHYTVDVFRAYAADYEAGQDSASDTGSASATPTAKVDASGSNIDQIQANIDKITSSQGDGPKATQQNTQGESSQWPGTAGTLGKKVYCTYWIRTGNCNYMQEGCKYKHEIPPDDDTRLAIGVRTYPTWPREDPVTAPRPPPVGVSPVPQVPMPPLQRPSWRRDEAKGAHAAGPRLSNRTNQSPAPVGAPESNASHAAQSSQGTDSRAPRPKAESVRPQPQFAAANADQHFPSSSNYVNNQQSNNNAPRTNSAQPGRHHQKEAPAKAASPNRPSATNVHHPQPVNSSNSAQQRSFPAQHAPSSHPGSETANTASQPYRNPFSQRMASGANARMDAQTQTPNSPAGPSASGAAMPTGGAKFANRAPPYMAVRPQGRANDFNTRPGAKDPSSSVQSSTRAGSMAAETSTSRMNTPTSSNSNAHGAFNGNADTSNTADPFSGGIPTNASAHTFDVNSFARNNNSAPFPFTGLDPAIIAARTHSPSNVKGYGSVLYDPKADTTTSTSDNGSNQNPSSEGSASLSDSPPLHYRRLFRAPGEPEYVSTTNNLEKAHVRSHGTPKKQHSGSGRKARNGGNGKGRGGQGQGNEGNEGNLLV